jgi:hypothetical protein
MKLDPHQLGFFIGRLVDDFDTLSELYKMKDEKDRSEIYYSSINTEIEEYQDRSVRHKLELEAYWAECEVEPKSDDEANDASHIQEIMEENAMLEHTLVQLQQQLGLEQWCEVLRLDLKQKNLRRQSELQAHIKHATAMLQA